VLEDAAPNPEAVHVDVHPQTGVASRAKVSPNSAMPRESSLETQKHRKSKWSGDTIDSMKAQKGHLLESSSNQGSLKIMSARSRVRYRVSSWCARLAQSKFMTATSVLLTMYALCGDDIRLSATNKPADDVFNALVIVCIVFFASEILITSLGKHDYFPGFFFVLDVISTASLSLDLTWVSDQLAAQQAAVGDKARSGRTARLGAMVGRMARVVRLIRIVKLYKAYYDKRANQTDRPKDIAAPSLEVPEDIWDKNKGKVLELDHHESLVSKKLSALTVKRIILLVLAMLLCLPLLQVSETSRFPSAGIWGASRVWQLFASAEAGITSRDLYESELLRFIYYHNWYLKGSTCPKGRRCAGSYYSLLFWFGLAGPNQNVLAQHTNSTRIRPAALSAWKANPDDSIQMFGTMPPQVESLLTAPWTVRCKENPQKNSLEYLGVSLLAQEVDGLVGYTVRCPTDLRPQEIAVFTPMLLSQAVFNQWHLEFFFDLRPLVREQSIWNMGITAFVCLVLCASSLVLSNDANVLVLHPVENMVHKINTIRDNPLIAVKMSEALYEVEEATKHKQRGSFKTQLQERLESWKLMRVFLGHGKKHELLETVVLERTIIKLGSLLALGFGEAGVKIVSANMQCLETAGVNAMIPGVKAQAIVGSARIRHFNVATEVLSGKVMKFVNQIAEIVHGIVNEFSGSVNKNKGDTFFVVWRASDLDDAQLTKLADMALFAFARILGAVHQSPLLATYRSHPGLQQRLGSHFRVDLGFGLHYGWVIEGAIGSEFKIDASYLSPNVNIAENIEHATKIYGVSFLASESIVKLCTENVAEMCRLVDCVIIKGSKAPLELFSMDLVASDLTVAEAKPKMQWGLRHKFRCRQQMERQKENKWNEAVHIADLFEESRDVARMRKRISTKFLQTFNMGYQNYSEGEWQVAKRFLEETSIMLKIDDGPSKALLSFMKTYNFEAPKGWHGVHDL